MHLFMLKEIFTDPVKESLEFNEAPIVLSLLVGFLIFAFLFFGYKSFDKRIMVQIDKSGIWSRKFKLIEWSNIWYLYLKELKGKHGGLFLYVKIHSPEKELKITLSHLDKSEEQIIEALKLFSRNHNIQFLEKEIINNNFV